MSKKKKYDTMRIEIAYIPPSDVITTSGLSNDDEPTHDENGWA